MSDDVRLRATGPIDSLDPGTLRALRDRAASLDPGIRERTAALIDDVRRDGDAALRAQALRFDGVTLDALEVPREARTRALAMLPPELRTALDHAARNIAAVHRTFAPRAMVVSPEPGVTVGRRPDPLARVGVYAPGGRAAYPSSLLMGAIPARVAGVGEVVVCSPAGVDGLPSAVVLAAAALAEVDRVFAIGGAGAIAAMALGTESVPRVDRIVGPGNAYVAAAKLQLVGSVAIDAPAGPSELLVLAADGADPQLLAREIVAQAEHDPDAAVIAVVYGLNAERTLDAIRAALRDALSSAPRAGIARRSLRERGALLTAVDEGAAVAFANEWAAEHVLLAVRDDRRSEVLGRLRAAGTVFVGESSSVVFGDYITGANHVLPTGGMTRCYSGLSTTDFVRWTSWQSITPAAAARLADDTGSLADAEGLGSHAAAARAWAGRGDTQADDAQSTSRLAVARAVYDTLSLYDPQRAPVKLDLTDNTNLWGLPPSAERALREVDASTIARYPSPYATELKDAAAAYLGVTPDMIVTGCGSDDILDAAMRAFGEPGDVVASSIPSFGMIPVFAQMNALRWRGVTEFRSHQPDVDGLLATGACITYLCSPNNPTGVAIAREAIERLVDEAAGVVLIDEAYAEFAGASVVDLVGRSDRVLVIRTMSKAFGLAGLRIGYAVGHPSLVREVEKLRGPYKVSALAGHMAVAAFRDDVSWVREHARLAVQAGERFAGELGARGLSPVPSQANFVCVPVPNCVAVGQALRARGVAARPFQALPHVGDVLRVTVGPWHLLERFLSALVPALREVNG